MAAYLILSSVVFMSFLAGATTFPFLSLYAQSLGASLAQIAWVVGVNATASLLTNLFWGGQVDRAGRRKPFIVGAMATLTVTSLAMANVPVGSWWLLPPIQIVSGIASGGYAIASLAMMGAILEGHPNRATMLGGYRMSGSLAFSVAILMAGAIARRSGFHTTFTAAAGMYAVALLLALLLREPKQVAATDRPRPAFRALLAGPMRPLLILIMSFWAPFAAVQTVWGPYVSTSLGYGPDGYARFWAIAAFVEVPCMLLVGYLADRYSRCLTFTLGLGGIALVFAAYALIPSTGGLIAAQILRGFAFAAFTATALTMVIELSPPEARGRVASLYQVSQGTAAMLGSYGGGPIAQAFGYRAIFLLSACTVALGAGYAHVRLGAARPEPVPAVAVG